VTYLPAALKCLTISLTTRFEDIPLFEPWLRHLRNLTFLDVAVCRNPLTLTPWGPFRSCQQLTDVMAPTSRDQMPRLEESRLMSDNQTCFNERDILLALALFPKVQKLGLAHILIKSQLNNAISWESFSRRLAPEASHQLWLLDPRNLWFKGTGRDGHYAMEKYRIDDCLRAAARDVRLMDTNSLWVQDSEPPERRDFDYPASLSSSRCRSGRCRNRDAANVIMSFLAKPCLRFQWSPWRCWLPLCGLTGSIVRAVALPQPFTVSSFVSLRRASASPGSSVAW
jgi:hypothetical protein